MRIFVCVLALIICTRATSAEVERDPASRRRAAPLSKEDRRILERGEIDQSRYIWGGVTGSIVGFGIGHAIQKRYGDIGWVFTAGEATSYTLFFIGILTCFGGRPQGQSCTPPALLVDGGLIGFVGFHIWEIVDLWVAPPRINARYRALTGGQRRSEFMILPTYARNSPGLGVLMTF